MSKENELLFVALGGVGEIGMNLALYGIGPADDREWLMVDCGVSFAGDELPGVDLVLPDIEFAVGLGKALKGIVVTHAHEDHYGALHALWPQLQCPVWATDFTAGLMEAKSAAEPARQAVPVTRYRAGDRFSVGRFDIEAVHVTHSIPEPVSLILRTALGQIVHTGDWKLDDAPSLGANTDGATLRRAGDEGVIALVCDSTNAMRSGTSPTEEEVAESLAQIISAAAGRVALTTFSSNVGRIRSMALAAHRAGRKTMLVGPSIRRMVAVATDLGMMEGLDEFVAEEEFDSIPKRELAIILTGSQGENRAALAKLSRDEHPRIQLDEGDTVIYSSRAIPGNEKAINETRNLLIDRGVLVIGDGDGLVHVSGHPRRDELKQMYDWVRPQILVPVHGEAMHLKAHAQFGTQMGIAQVAQVRNGDILRIAPGKAEVVGQAPVGRLFKDGNIVGSAEDTGVTGRRKLSFSGLVACSIVLDSEGKFADDIDIELHGMPGSTAQGAAFDEVLFDAAFGAVTSIPRGRRKDDEVIRMAVTKAIRAESRNQWGKKPVVTVFVARV